MSIPEENEPAQVVSGQTDDSSNLESFFANILTPGSSLHPTFQIILDAAFAALFTILLTLAILTSGNIHIFALLLIEVALWASVKWFVNELKKAPASSVNGCAEQDVNAGVQNSVQEQEMKKDQ